jgi:hypothetical protein
MNMGKTYTWRKSIKYKKTYNQSTWTNAEMKDDRHGAHQYWNWAHILLRFRILVNPYLHVKLLL